MKRCFHKWKKTKEKKLDWIYKLKPQDFKRPVYQDVFVCTKCGKEYKSENMLLCYSCGSEITFLNRLFFNYTHGCMGDSHRKCPRIIK